MGKSPYCRYYDRIIPKSRHKVKESHKKDLSLPTVTFMQSAVYAENSRELDGSAIFGEYFELIGSAGALQKAGDGENPFSDEEKTDCAATTYPERKKDAETAQQKS